MTLRFELLGYEVARITVDVEPTLESPEKVVDKAVKSISKRWVKHMIGEG